MPGHSCKTAPLAIEQGVLNLDDEQAHTQAPAKHIPKGLPMVDVGLRGFTTAWTICVTKRVMPFTQKMVPVHRRQHYASKRNHFINIKFGNFGRTRRWVSQVVAFLKHDFRIVKEIHVV